MQTTHKKIGVRTTNSDNNNTKEIIDTANSITKKSSCQVNFDLSIFEVVDQKVNLTKMCQNFGKEIKRWLQNPTTKKYLTVLESVDGKSAITILQGNFANGETQGTFGTREVALKVAQWISPDFEVFCIKKLDTLFQTGKVELAPALQPTAPKEFSLDQLLEQNQNWIVKLSKQVEILKIEVETKDNTISSLTPKADFVDNVLVKGNTGLTAMSIVAKEMGLGSVRLYKILRDEKIWFWALNEHGVNENNVRQEYIDNGSFVVKSFYSERDKRTYDKIFATNKGKLLCYKLVKESQNAPKFEIKLIENSQN